MIDIRATDAPQPRSSKCFRRLRIAASVFFAVVTVALCVLWVRSYQYNEIYSRISNSGRLVTVGSSSGFVYLYSRLGRLTPPRVGGPFRSGMNWQAHDWRYSRGHASDSRWMPSVKPIMTGVNISLPLWLLVSLAVVGGCLPWYVPRFSLRIMLIATTLFAIALGLGVWTSR